MASFSHDTIPQGSPERGSRLERPSFSSQKTADRLRECERRPSIAPTTMGTKKKQQRRSVFREEGLDDLRSSVYRGGPDPGASPRTLYMVEEDMHKMDMVRTHEEIMKEKSSQGESLSSRKEDLHSHDNSWYSKFAMGSRPMIKSSASAPHGSFPSLPKVALIVFLIAVVVPGFRYTQGVDKVNIGGADAGVIRTADLVDNASSIEGRADSPTSTCTRWAHQIANVNGTVYIYGGQAKSTSGQNTDTWNNNFLTLDLTKTWKRTDPALKGLPQPVGPPAVSMGSLWHSYTSLFLYGGEFSDSTPKSPLPVSTWEYDIKAAKWTEWANPKTSIGNHSEAGNIPVQRSAEGAGLSVPELGKSWYFGGHLDMFTTSGWSNQIARVYLRSMLEFTHPGYANTGVSSLGSTNAAPQGGTYRNITEGGLQDSAGFTERADGALVYIPGWGNEGIVLGLAGGTNESFTDMNTIDIYDVANSTWYKQATSGESPPIRVNPCVGVVAAPDGTSFQVHLYGGQNLIPFGSQIQYRDMWILTVPSFTWIQVPIDSSQSPPPARAGHQCTIWDGQMVVIGGYVGRDISCDSPGIYVFNASSLQWQNSFVSLGPSSGSSDTPGPSGSGQFSETVDQGFSIIQGSRGYQVPALVQSVIGGSSNGGATATSPAVGAATAGPIATGKPPTFTVTQSGSIVTQTASPGPGSGSSNNGIKKTGTNTGAVIAGVIAGLFAILAAYLAFCSWLYRKQLKLYKDHVAMAQRTAFTNSPENAMWSSETGSEHLAMVKSNEKPPGVLLGPFGTEIAGSGGRQSGSVGRSSTGSRLTPGSGAAGTSGESSGSAYEHGYGGGVMPGGRYGRMSEGDEGIEYLGATDPGGYGHGPPEGRSQTAHSSVEDLLGGQEPSFFAVILNPRRTLRVVNQD